MSVAEGAVGSGGAAVAPARTPDDSRRAVVASAIGTIIEWYDFFIYGTAAALVFGPQFFPNVTPLAGVLASFATFSVAYIARPIGAALMGHFGDRVGRKSMLVVALLLMGVATTGIGLLPTYAQIGIMAPILLAALRFVQGFGLGGEWGGAILLSVEHAPARRRGFYGALPQMGNPIGTILSTSVFLVLAATLSDEQFTAWGWRIPFLLSAVLVVVGLLVRIAVVESPEFAALETASGTRRLPLLDVLRTEWRNVGAGTLLSMPPATLGIVVLVFFLFYGTTELGIPRPTMLWITIVASVFWVLAIGMGGWVADRLGGRRSYLVGAALAVVLPFPLFWLMDTGAPVQVTLGMAGASVAVGWMAGAQAAHLADAFPVHLRYSGASLAYAAGGLLGGSFAPVISTALFGVTGDGFGVAGYLVGVALLGVLGVAALRSQPHAVTVPPEPG